MSVEFEGLSSLVGIVHTSPTAAKKSTFVAMLGVTNKVFNESQEQVPVHYGVLKASGDIIPDEVGMEVDITYGGPAADYALFVHEVNATHKHGKWHYLSDPANDHVDDLPEGITETFEYTIMGNYPQAPARAQQAEVRNDIRRAFPHSGPQKLAAEIARAHVMSQAEVKSALAGIDARKKRYGE